MKLLCPRCNVGLARRWAGKALYQLCSSCHGIAITKYALAGIADPNEVHTLWTQAVANAKPSGAKCPSCIKAMIFAHSYDGQGKQVLELDACVSCQLLWLDKGEYEGIHSKVAAPIPVANEPLVDAAYVEKKKEDDSSYGIGTIALTLMGLPVEEDVGVLAKEPVFTRGLTALIFAVSLWGFSHHEEMIRRFAFIPSAEPLQLFITGFTSFFFHSGWWHLFGNMYFFWVFGDDVENDLGHDGFLWLLFGSEILGNVLYCFGADPSSAVIGASGGITGLILYYVIRYPQRRFRIMFLFMIFQVRAWVVGAMYLFMDLVGSIAQISGHGDHVSHLSHLGGALVGMLAGLYMQAQSKKI